MGQPVIQTSFNAGEWAPALNARVDMAKYHSGAALLRNFFVDYRGGATTRPGTRYILQCDTSNAAVRLIPFQASFTVGYILEFGNFYIRFFFNGAPVLETATTITSAAAGPPEVFTDAGHGYSNFNWLFIQGSYYVVHNATTNTFTLNDLFGNAINTNPFTLPVSAQRVYRVASPYAASDLQLIKYAQNVNELILCHPSYPAQVLTLNTATNWTIAPITFGPTLATPGSPVIGSSSTSGTDCLAYIITAVDINGNESAPTTPIHILNRNFTTATTRWTNELFWTTSTGAQSYNIYKSNTSNIGPVANGAQYGFIGNSTGASFQDSLIVPDFSQGPPIIRNPFQGASIIGFGSFAAGSGYTSVPTVTIGAPPSGGIQATANTVLTGVSITIASGGSSYNVGDLINTGASGGILASVIATGGGGAVTAISVITSGGWNTGTVPSNPLSTFVSGGAGAGATLNVSWGVTSPALGNPGAGYTSVPSVTFSGGGGTGAAATAILNPISSGNPAAVGFIQQRSVFGAPVMSPSQINLSQPGSPFDFNVSNPVADDDAIQETLTNTTLNTIKGFVAVSAGLLIFTDKGAWVVNGGSSGAPIGATTIVANPQNYSGSSDLPPIQTPQDLLYVQSKGSIVRDLAYNFYLNNYVGNDISILSSHLFYTFTLTQWAWAEEPFKLVWAVRNDGVLLSLAFVKEQELIAWAHHDTQGSYTSVASVTENTSIGNVDAVYLIAQRTIQGQSLQYIERFVELNYPNDYKSSWQVDAGIGYNGSPQTTFSGAQHLGGQAVTGVADGVVINFTMPTSGTFVFGTGGTPGLTGIPSASIVTVGLSFLPQIQTLRLDLGEPTAQGKRKKISAVTTRVRQALGLAIGSTFSTLTVMKDLVLGNIGTMSNAQVTGLVTDDARTIIDPNWTVQGQFCIQQNNPYPASVLGIIPEIDVGDTPK